MKEDMHDRRDRPGTVPRAQRLLCLSVLAITIACSPRPTQLTDEDRAAIAAAVDSATRAFETAQRERNAGRVIAHFAPDFSMRVDGVRMGYDSVASSIRRSMPELTYLEPAFSDITVGVLDRDVAFASFIFRDSAVARSGDIRISTGPTTLIWQRRDGRWLMVFADADHR
jgi:ketosteroid isomerase-like protein